jgi:membrane protease YdiL (CAAX protease family)
MNSAKQWMLSIPGALFVVAALTLVVLAESIFPPWAPYFIVYAILAIVIPLALGSYAFGSIREVTARHWKLILGVFILALIVDQGIAGGLYQRVLDLLGVGGDPYYSLDAALGKLADVAAVKFGISPDAAMGLYALFILIWAPIGEELFYRGYLQGVLRSRWSFRASALVSAAFFGIRHATHFFFLFPDVPWIAAASWVASAFVFGLFMSWLYEKTRSLYPPILVHAALNLIDLALSL